MKAPRHILRDEQGTAFAEALVVLPLFAAALVAIVALNNMYGAKLEAKARARRMAWLQADSGDCPVTNCGSDCGLAENEMRSGLDAAFGSEDQSLLGEAASYVLGTSTHGVGTATAPMPRAIGGGSTTQSGRTTLLCNTTSRNTSNGRNVLEDACATGLRGVDYASEVCP